DMLFWPTLCRCEHCRRRFTEETGRAELPLTVNWHDDAWRDFARLRTEWMGEFAMWATKETRRILGEHITVEHNYASGVAGDWGNGATELVNEACDYTGGDLYGDLYNHSFTAKYYYNVTMNQPFEYMTVRCDNRLAVHTNSKTEEHLATEVMLTAAHHGASFIIDAIDPVGTLDPRVYDRVGKVFERQMPYEKYFSGDMVQDVAVYYTTTGHYNSRGQNYDNKTCSVNLTRALIEENIPVGVIGNRRTSDMARYRMVFAPQMAFMDEKNIDDMVRYVENGGVLYLSGVEDTKVIERLLGARLKEWTDTGMVYMAPTDAGAEIFCDFTAKYPFPTEMSLPVIEVEGAEVMATMTFPYTKTGERKFASIHSNPPGIPSDIPAMVAKKLGRGIVIWSACPIENDTRRSHRKLLKNLIARYIDLGALTVRTNAPRQVELVTFQRADDTLISAVDLLCTDELLTVPKFTVEVKCAKPERVVRIGGKDRADAEIPFTWADGYVKFDVDGLVMFDMYRIQYLKVDALIR
ncbi:MAG: beta-galactosidase trimerization domain-containing protein, partial [Clostridia bacterium]|nr:beta-galactosidase trimerization domain-containing protein [Clostridia bacterium]